MNLAATRWLIGLSNTLPEPLFLHVFDDDSHDWLPEKTRALRFASKYEAERFASAHLNCAFLASEHPAAEVVGAADQVPEDEAASFVF